MLEVSPPKVSVAVITYRHERFVAAALDSVLAQQTPFPVEIVVGEDCSPDGTAEIVRAYAERWPERVRVLQRETNLGMHGNWIETIRACRGEYVALLEGDDFWTAPDKLQKQVEFLDGYPECSLCFHRVASVDDESGAVRSLNPAWTPPRISTFEDLLVENYIPTCSVLFRRASMPEPPEWYYTLKFADWPLHLLNARQGKLAFLDEVMASYRMHEGGIWSSRAPMHRLQEIQRFYHVIDRHFHGEYRGLIRQGLRKYARYAAAECRECAWHHLREDRHGEAWQEYLHALRLNPGYLADAGLLRDLLSLGKRSVGLALGRGS